MQGHRVGHRYVRCTATISVHCHAVQCHHASRRTESGMREIVPRRTRSVEVGRRVDRESVRERVRVDELNVCRRIGDHLRV
jgi:hypothetical protein